METGNHGSMRKLKNTGLKALSAKHHQSSMENSSWEMAIQSDIDAAHALVQLSNEDPGLLHIALRSHGMKHSVNGTPSIKDLRGKSEGGRTLGTSHSKVSGRKINFFVKHQQVDFRGQMKDGDAVGLDFPLSAMPYPAGRKQKRMKMFKNQSSLQPKYWKNNVTDKDDTSYEACQLLDGHELTSRWGNNGQKPTEVYLEDCHDRLGMLRTKKRKMQGFKLAVPTVHTGFSFSVIHLLSAIRRAMVALHEEDDAVVSGNGLGESNAEEINGFYSLKDKGTGDSVQTNSKGLPSLTLKKIVERVRSTPMDHSILQTQEPLQDLVRGVLEIFSSKAAPLGAKGWKPLTLYHKSGKCWSWIGPITLNSCNADDKDVSSEAWSLHHNMLVKLVDSFAIWYQSFQDRLRQVGSLPAPPLALLQPTLDESERLRGVSTRKCTISPSSEEVRAYFQKEEALRYLVPDRSFSYTALDGRKSAVAPLSRCSGNPSSRNRDHKNHFMVKADRPAHITIPCLVRDAAARLPGSIGTRADICTLIRDSQYIVEEVSDEQLGQAASAALDRLHYESDPCVKFDRGKKLWVYLHGNRGEEDFEEDGTSSTVRKRPPGMLISKLSVHDTVLKNGQEETRKSICR